MFWIPGIHDMYNAKGNINLHWTPLHAVHKYVQQKCPRVKDLFRLLRRVLKSNLNDHLLERPQQTIDYQISTTYSQRRVKLIAVRMGEPSHRLLSQFGGKWHSADRCCWQQQQEENRFDEANKMSFQVFLQDQWRVCWTTTTMEHDHSWPFPLHFWIP